MSRYLENPLLVGGRKFDLRIYALVLSYMPLKVYFYRGGFCRFTSERYSMDRDDMTNLYVHLTNVAIQKKGENYDRWPRSPLLCPRTQPSSALGVSSSSSAPLC